MQYMQANADIYNENGYLAPIVSVASPPASTHKPSRLSDGALAAVIFTVLLVAAVTTVAVGAILTKWVKKLSVVIPSLTEYHLNANYFNYTQTLIL